MFLKALLTHLRSGSGTPLRKERVLEDYIFELVEKDAKKGLGVEDFCIKYSFDFSDRGKVRRFKEFLLDSLWK